MSSLVTPAAVRMPPSFSTSAATLVCASVQMAASLHGNDLLLQAFYSCHVYQLIQKLLSSRGVSSAALPPTSLASPQSRATPAPATAPTAERSLVVVPVDLGSLPPRTYTYGAWFEYCLQQRQLLCLGLYRSNGGDASPFVYTNPPAVSTNGRVARITGAALQTCLASCGRAVRSGKLCHSVA
jgi:hypothetical protein